MVFRECLENKTAIFTSGKVTRPRQKLHFKTFLFNILSLGDDKYYCTSLLQFFRALIPHPLQITSAVDLAARMCFYRSPFVLSFSFNFDFETRKKSMKVSER